MKKLNPEGFNKSISFSPDCKRLLKSIKNHKKVLGKVVAFSPDYGFYTICLTQKDSILGTLKSDGNDIYKTLVGHTIECYVMLVDGEYYVARSIHESTEWCLNHYQVGDIVNCKLLSYTPIGAIFDIGGGCNAFFSRDDANVAHLSQLYKIGEVVKLRIKRINIEEKKFYLMY